MLNYKREGENMRSIEITKRQKLLDEFGNIKNPGWAKSQFWEYDRKDIKAPRWRIKEWDYYLVVGKDFATAFTISDDGYIGLQSVSFLKLDDNPWEKTNTVLNLFPMGKLKMPKNSSKGDVHFENKKLNMTFEKYEYSRHITCEFKNFYNKKDFKCDITLEQPEMDTLTIATPFKKNKHFYYNQKINCMKASGYVICNGEKYEFNPKTDYGTLDWGRGVWTYDNTWYWGSGNAKVDGHDFGFNIGYGFGDTSKASENVIFYDGKANKFDDVTFVIPEDDYLKPWKFTSSDGRFEMDFKPILDRNAKLNALVILSDQHQVFGKMSGTAILDDGTKIKIKDVLCFAEKVHNKY